MHWILFFFNPPQICVKISTCLRNQSWSLISWRDDRTFYMSLWPLNSFLPCFVVSSHHNVCLHISDDYNCAYTWAVLQVFVMRKKVFQGYVSSQSNVGIKKNQKLSCASLKLLKCKSSSNSLFTWIQLTKTHPCTHTFTHIYTTVNLPVLLHVLIFWGMLLWVSRYGLEIGSGDKRSRRILEITVRFLWVNVEELLSLVYSLQTFRQFKLHVTCQAYLGVSMETREDNSSTCNP